MEDIEEILIEEDPGMFEESSSDDVILESFIERCIACLLGLLTIY